MITYLSDSTPKGHKIIAVGDDHDLLEVRVETQEDGSIMVTIDRLPACNVPVEVKDLPGWPLRPEAERP